MQRESRIAPATNKTKKIKKERNWAKLFFRKARNRETCDVLCDALRLWAAA
jgi:hypothetical protein